MIGIWYRAVEGRKWLFICQGLRDTRHSSSLITDLAQAKHALQTRLQGLSNWVYVWEPSIAYEVDASRNGAAWRGLYVGAITLPQHS
jgi:hypothetical protein